MGPCVGIDVAKHTLEWSTESTGTIQHTRNEPRPIAGLVRRLVALAIDARLLALFGEKVEPKIRPTWPRRTAGRPPARPCVAPSRRS